MTPAPTWCMHCGKPVRTDHRPPAPVCWQCWVQHAGDEDFDFAEKPLPPKPTRALPGSPGKLVVLQDRATDRVALFHPGDAPLPSVVLTLLGEIVAAGLLERKPEPFDLPEVA